MAHWRGSWAPMAQKVQSVEQPRSAFEWRFVRESIAFVSVRGNKIGMGAYLSR